MCSRSPGGIPLAFVQDLQEDRGPVAPALDADGGSGRGIFCRIVQKIEQDLLEQHRIDLHHGQVGGELELDAVSAPGSWRRAAARSDDLAQVVQRRVGRDRAGLELGHVEQIGDEAIEPLRLVDDGGQKLGLGGLAEPAREIAKRAGGAEDGGERRLEIVRDRGEQRGTQAVGLDGPLGALQVLDQMDALDRERALVDQRVEQAPLVGGEQRPRLVAVDADDADGATAGPHRQEQPLGARKRVRAAPGRPVVFPRPVGRREVGLVERVLGRISGLHRDGPVLGQQQHDADLQHQGGLIGRGPQHVVERADARELAAEGIERLDRAGAPLRGHDRAPAARRHVRDNDRNDDEEHESRDIGRIGDREGVDRRQEEEIVAKRRHDAREQRRQQTEPYRDADDGGEQHQIDVLDAEQRLDQHADAERHGDRQKRGHIGTHVERLGFLGHANGLLRNRLALDLVARDDVHADIAGPSHQIVHDRAVQDLEPARARRLADDDLGDIVLVREADHVVGDLPQSARNRDRLAAQAFGEPQRVGDAIALLLAQLQAAPRFDVERGPGRVQAIGQALGVAHEAGRARILADADQDALAGRPRTRNGVRLHLGEQLLVDPLGGAAQRQLAQRRQVAGRKKMLERALGLRRDVDLAFLQSLDQIVGREVDQLDRVGAIENRSPARFRARAHG